MRFRLFGVGVEERATDRHGQRAMIYSSSTCRLFCVTEVVQPQEAPASRTVGPTLHTATRAEDTAGAAHHG